MTTREKVAHLLRRFGLGVTRAELDRLEPLGVQGALGHLLDYEKTDEGFPVSPWEFSLQNDENINLDPNRFAAWWGLRMVMTRRPLQEKLTVFWHDHFAISSSKVESGAMMLQNNETIRAHAAGNFRTLLGEMAKDPAMLRWLDGDTSIRGRPNENFAREVLELFTLGIGNYTEKDIQELARAFTGWSLRAGYRNPPRGGSPRKALMETLALGLPLVASSYSHGLHDPGPKTILGKTANFDTESALDWIVSRPQTAKYVCTKLWEYFAYPNPEAKVVERLAKAFAAAKYEIKPVLRAIAESPEFWSEKCVRRQVKSPLDFTVAFVRQLDLGDRLRATHAAELAKPAEGKAMSGMETMGPSGSDHGGLMKMKPVPAGLAGTGGMVTTTMARLGMRLFYPPDVAGWEWGEGWVSPAMMAERMRFANSLVQRGRNTTISDAIRVQLTAGGGPQTVEALVESFAQIFDAPIPPDRKAVLMQAAQASGGPAALQQPQTAAPLLQNLARLTFGMPEFQLC
jgi:uncharacterized protein (DUF1800 family)